MNSFDKAIELKIRRSNKPKNEPKYYRYRTLYTSHFWLFPIVVVCYWYDAYMNALNEWSIRRTEKILKSVFPKVCSIDERGGKLYLELRKNYWNFNWKWYCGIFDKYYCDKYDKRISEYLKSDFEIDGYKKIVEEYDDDWLTVSFKKIL